VTIHTTMWIALKHMPYQNFYLKNVIKTAQILTFKQHRMKLKPNVLRIAKKKPTNHLICTCVFNTILPSKKHGETILMSANILVWRLNMEVILLIFIKWALVEISAILIHTQNLQVISHNLPRKSKSKWVH